MKNEHVKSMKWLISSLLMLSMPLFPNAMAQEIPDNYYTVSGVIKDQVTKRALSFVDISVPGTNIGTVTNQDGQFSLKIGKELKVSEILFSCIGYSNSHISVNKADMLNGVYFLSPSIGVISAVIVEGWDALRLVEEAVLRINKNYSTIPNLLTGFYRETAQKRSRFINVSEAVLSIYKGPYDEGDINRDRVQIIKGRQLVSTRVSDTLGVRILGGPNISIFLDVVKNVDLLLDKEALSLVQFRLEPSTVIDLRPQYVVSFRPVAVMPYALHYGALYIDKETLAITRAEFYLDMSNPEKATEAILRKKPAGMRFKPEELYVLVNYKQQDGKTYLSYIRNVMKFSCDWKRRLFATNYSATSEMVVTERRDNNILPISRSNSFGVMESLSTKVIHFYDEDFWGAYNIIEPTETLESAVSRLRRQQR